MPDTNRSAGLFPAQLKYWRHKRGLSQLDFSLAADVSSRHISFLETGRAKPSEDMVLRLASVLSLPLRDQNALLRAAGFPAAFEEARELPDTVTTVLDRMLRQMDPCPVVVMDRCYNMVTTNRAGAAMLTMFVADPSALTDPPNLMHALFNPGLGRPFLRDWENLARFMLSRMHQQALLHDDDGLRALIDEVQSYPGVPEDWRKPDFSTGGDPVLTMRIGLPDIELVFMVTLTRFSESQMVSLEELQIETYLPADAVTEQFCESLFG